MSKLKQYIVDIINKVRQLKHKLSHDNLFDIVAGTALAFVGLRIYLDHAEIDKLIIIALPGLFSWLNELLNVWQGSRFGWIDLGFRMFAGITLYFII
jgi:hypothetical protein